jgi:hypothetical protein
MPRRLLIVITTEVADVALRDLVRTRAGDDAEMLAVGRRSIALRLQTCPRRSNAAAQC